MAYNWAPWQGAKRCTGYTTLGTRSILAWVLERYKGTARSGGIYVCRSMVGSSSTSLHAEGRAVDIMLPTSGGRPTATSLRVAGEIIKVLGTYGRSFGVQCIIWNRTIWTANNPSGRRYTGTHPHYDHMHIEVNWTGAKHLTLTKLRDGARRVLGSAPAPAPAPTTFSTIKQGSSGSAVRTAQTRLNLHGAKLTVDSQFGPATHSATLAFQRAKKLTADGIIGTRTWAELNKAPQTAPTPIPAPTTLLKQGSSGSAVRTAQTRLNLHGARLVVDGQFGPATHTAVVNFQRAKKLTADGIIGANTWKALNAAPAVTTKTGTVTARSGLVVRKTTGGVRIGALAYGTKVTVYSTSRGWHKIKYGTGHGYVSATYVKL